MFDQPMNEGIAYDDMTPEQKQVYHARIAASRRPGKGQLTSIGEILERIYEARKTLV